AGDLGAWAALAGAAAIGVYVIRFVSDRRLQWSFGHFACTLLPVLGLVPYGFQEFSFVADRNLYLACVGPFAALGAAVDVLARQIRPRLATILATAVAAVLALLTIGQIAIWHD